MRLTTRFWSRFLDKPRAKQYMASVESERIEIWQEVYPRAIRAMRASSMAMSSAHPMKPTIRGDVVVKDLTNFHANH